MYQVENRKVPLMGKELEYREIIKIILNTRSEKKGGFSIEEIRKRIKLLDIFDKCPQKNNIYLLEDADFEYLKGNIKEMIWGVVDREIVNFVDYIEGLGSQK